MIDAWLNMNQLPGYFFCQNRTNGIFFVTTSNKKESGFGSNSRKLLESGGQKIDPLQVKQAANVSHNNVLFCPAQPGADTTGLRTKEPIIEANWNFVSSISQSYSQTSQSVAVCTHRRQGKQCLLSIVRHGSGQTKNCWM